jgi:RES domain-containing protein
VPGRQAYGDQLLRAHKFGFIPSAVSTQSWNLIFVAAAATGAYDVKSQQPFAFDTRLHPPAA